MKKLYIFILFLLSLPLLGVAQQKDELKGHPIVGIWMHEDFDAEVSLNNKDIEAKVKDYIMGFNKTYEDKGDELLIFTENGGYIQGMYDKGDLGSSSIQIFYFGQYSISETKEGKEGVLNEKYSYKIKDDNLYMSFDSVSVMQILQEVTKREGVEMDSISIFSLDIKAKLRKTDLQLADLQNHPLTQGSWVLEDIAYELSPSVKDEEIINKVKANLNDLIDQQMAFWDKSILFREDGTASIVYEERPYFIVNERMLYVYAGWRSADSFDFSIEGDRLILTISDVEKEIELNSSLDEQILPFVEGAAVKMIFRLEK
ncbi:hypothetical protein [Dysgonomonas sp. Marseille-P4361]|uniref:hypothetical protein n=1 Tax=Dysgonomonas sp. Marseille-P4361 TaxID=2161820 RepID=UPI000D55810C|nr:hypothetical protein [Dysgonomonas sp. Marseille-P4361]